MSTSSIKTLIIVCSLLFLTACGTKTLDIRTTQLNQQSLGVEIPDPLVVRELKWEKFTSDGHTYFGLDEKSYFNYVKNQEDLQNRLYILTNIIEAQEAFYLDSSVQK